VPFDDTKMTLFAGGLMLRSSQTSQSDLCWFSANSYQFGAIWGQWTV